MMARSPIRDTVKAVRNVFTNLRVFNSLLTDTMDWFKTRGTQETPSADPMHRRASRPRAVDYTEELTANVDLTRGLWRNTYGDLKLAGSLAFPPIFVPLSLMGVPVPTSDDDTTQEQLTELLDDMAFTCWQIHKTCHRDGTCWVWPAYSPESGLRWEFIRDDTVSDILKDILTNEVIEIRTDEEISVSVGENNVQRVRRKRIFTRQRVTVIYENTSVQGLENVEYVNPAGELPIPFTNDGEPGEVRGVSDYSRILPDLKNYHDIDLAWTTMLSRFRAKLLLGVKDVDAWLANNGYDDIDDVDVAVADLLMMVEGETAEMITPPSTDAYPEKLKHTFHKLVEGSGIPEIVWGLKTEGNHASAEEQMASLVQYVRGKQMQKDDSYRRLISASLRLTSTARMVDPGDFDLAWNRLDAVSESVKAEIFKNVAQGIGYMMEHAALTDKILYNILKLNFPEATEEDLEEFKVGLVGMAKFRQFAQADLADAFDVAGIEQTPDQPEMPVDDASGNGQGTPEEVESLSQ